MSDKKRAYKLTNAQGRTHGDTEWGENVTHRASGEGKLCGSGWIHWYDDPLLAVLLNPIHADFSKPILWEGKAGGRMKQDHGLKYGSESFTTIRQIPLPEVTTAQRVAFGILAVLEVYQEKNFVDWAKNWLSGQDRTIKSAQAIGAAGAAEAAAAAGAAGAIDLVALAHRAMEYK